MRKSECSRLRFLLLLGNVSECLRVSHSKMFRFRCEAKLFSLLHVTIRNCMVLQCSTCFSCSGAIWEKPQSVQSLPALLELLQNQRRGILCWHLKYVWNAFHSSTVHQTHHDKRSLISGALDRTSFTKSTKIIKEYQRYTKHVTLIFFVSFSYILIILEISGLPQ